MGYHTNCRQLLKNAALAGAGFLMAGTDVLAEDDSPKKKEPMKLRPHHLLDIVSAHGRGVKFKPNPYGHSLHIVAPIVISNLDLKVEFMIGADAICHGCKHLLPNGLCDDVLHQLSPPISKQKYNDDLDHRLFDYLKFTAGTVMTVLEFLKIVNEKVPGIEKICTHPKENQQQRLKGLVLCLQKFGIRKKENTTG